VGHGALARRAKPPAADQALVSASGRGSELAYEVAVPARFGAALMTVLMSAGAEFDAVASGTEALGVMRIEKGHAAGNELNGQTTARDLGLGRMVSAKKDCIGAKLSRRPELNRVDGLRPPTRCAAARPRSRSSAALRRPRGSAPA